jgi:site-specific DNA-methyltransferase (cytosine-N4-specific)
LLIDDSITFFKKHIQDHYRKLIKLSDNTENDIDLRCGDSKDILKSFPVRSVDLICTSPPYGDNHTTVTYGQYSILPLLWIDKADLPIWNEGLLERFTAIDSASLGGTIKRGKPDAGKYAEILNGISCSKQKKVIAFLEDYELVFQNLTYLLKPGKLMVLTLGNRRVDNKEIKFDLFNDMLAQQYGLVQDSTITRNIFGKRMPSRVSNVGNHGAVKSISKEYVKVYRKAASNG